MTTRPAIAVTTQTTRTFEVALDERQMKAAVASWLRQTHGVEAPDGLQIEIVDRFEPSIKASWSETDSDTETL